MAVERDARLEHRRIVGRFVAREREVGAAECLESRQCVGPAVVPCGGKRGRETLEAAQRHLGQQRLGVAEMTIRRAGADAGQPRRFGDGEPAGPFSAISASAASTSASRRLP